MDKKLLGITIIAFVVGLGLGLAIGFAAKIHRFLVDYDALNNDYTQLQANYTWLKQHSFTYHTVGDTINISDVTIEYGFLNYCSITGSITNISNKPIGTVYVFLVVRNSDGTIDSTPDDYREINGLYMNETVPFEFTYLLDEDQTVEIQLIYQHK